jgi:hypothetical protein
MEYDTSHVPEKNEIVFTMTSEKNGNTMGQCIGYSQTSRRPANQLREKFCTTFCFNLM